MLDIKTDGNTETYHITFDSDDIRNVLSYYGHKDASLDKVQDIAFALSDMFDEYFAEWVVERKD